MRVVDEFDGGIGWIDEGRIPRTSHALAGWLIDAVEPLPDSVGEVRGVIQLLDRHNRDCAALAARFSVPHLRAFEACDTVSQAGFEALRVLDRRWWREVALWWPERRVLVCADALGTLPYFRARGERIGVHPLLRLTPPRRLASLAPERILVGHGAGVHENAAAALAGALATARPRAPAAWAAAVRVARRR